MRNPEYEFVSPDAGELTALLEQGYTQITGQALRPGSPEQLFVRWAAGIMVQLRVLMNYVGNQNIPSRAEGENLDALAQLFYAQERPRAKAAVCTQRFHISQAQATAILIPAGTRVTGPGGLVFETAEDGYVPIGETFADVQARCQTLGVAGNGVPPGALDSAVDLYDYYIATENVTASGGGADEATDEEFCQLMRQSMDAYSCAGARGGYEYFAKQVSTEIADVIANSPSPGVVKLYVLMEGGALAGEEVKGAVEKAASAVYPNTRVQEWFEYGGEPYRFKLDVGLGEFEWDRERHKRLMWGLGYYKNLRSHLEAVEYHVPPVEVENWQAFCFTALSLLAGLGNRPGGLGPNRLVLPYQALTGTAAALSGLVVSACQRQQQSFSAGGFYQAREANLQRLGFQKIRIRSKTFTQETVGASVTSSNLDWRFNRQHQFNGRKKFNGGIKRSEL